MQFTPKTETELAEIVAGLQAPVKLQGGGTRAIGHSIAQDVLDMSVISGVVDYEPGALTLVAKAGTPLAEIDALLAAEKQRLSFEPMDHRTLLGTQGEPTIGGAVAANVSGPRRISVGAC
ncbi:MAG: FAD-binding protein, partial [Lentibacter algarum]|uniref:FAD-binding protein n=1 Tax=Lentibacter algarum TaxID=576131 RepID=UPI003C714010